MDDTCSWDSSDNLIPDPVTTPHGLTTTSRQSTDENQRTFRNRKNDDKSNDPDLINNDNPKCQRHNSQIRVKPVIERYHDTLLKSNQLATESQTYEHWAKKLLEQQKRKDAKGLFRYMGI